MEREKRTPYASLLSALALAALIAMGIMSALPDYNPNPYWGAFLLVVYLVSMGYGALVQALIEAKYGG